MIIERCKTSSAISLLDESHHKLYKHNNSSTAAAAAKSI
jgi:hypothetical protein